MMKTMSSPPPCTPTYPHLQAHRVHRRPHGPGSQGAATAMPMVAATTPTSPPATPADSAHATADLDPGLSDWQQLLLTAALGFAVSLGTGLVAGLLCSST